MKYKITGNCPMCGNPLKSAILPNGKAIPMSCECERKERRAIEDKRASVERKLDIKTAEKQFLETAGERYKDKTLENYVLDKNGKDKDHYRLIKAMANNFEKFAEKGTGGLVFGGYGCGKTHLEVGLGRKLIQKGYSVKLFDTSALYTKYMSAYSWRLAYSPTDVIEDACDADLLILDDMGVNTVSSDKDNFVKFIYGLINYRYNQKKPVLISTNLKQKELMEAVTPRVFDRIKAMTYPVTNYRSSMRVNGKR